MTPFGIINHIQTIFFAVLYTIYYIFIIIIIIIITIIVIYIYNDKLIILTYVIMELPTLKSI
jgi:hypothetical protein